MTVCGPHGKTTGRNSRCWPDRSGHSRTAPFRHSAGFPWSRPGETLVGEGAPGAIRTHTGRVLNPLPLPLGYGGAAHRCDGRSKGSVSEPPPFPGAPVRLPRTMVAHGVGDGGAVV